MSETFLSGTISHKLTKDILKSDLNWVNENLNISKVLQAFEFHFPLLIIKKTHHKCLIYTIF